MTHQPYYKIDHFHCWEQDNSPCGIKGRHRCCLCEEPTPPTDDAVSVEDVLNKALATLKGWSCQTGEYMSEWVYEASDVREMLRTTLEAERARAKEREVALVMAILAEEQWIEDDEGCGMGLYSNDIRTIATRHGIDLNKK